MANLWDEPAGPHGVGPYELRVVCVCYHGRCKLFCPVAFEHVEQAFGEYAAQEASFCQSLAC